MKKSPHVHSVSHKPLASALSEIFIKGRWAEESQDIT